MSVLLKESLLGEKMSIDYDKLKLAIELGEKYSINNCPRRINIIVSFKMCKMSYVSSITEDGKLLFDWECENIEDIIAKLQELVEPDPNTNPVRELKYNIGDKVWCLDDRHNLDFFIISQVDWDSEESYYSYDKEHWWFEEQLYPSREALIEAQIDYWTSLRTVSEKESVECQHESDCYIYHSRKKLMTLIPIDTPYSEIIERGGHYKCKYCGEFYK